MGGTLFARRMRLAGFVLAGAVLASVVGFAQAAAKPAAVTGEYEGWTRGSVEGDFTVTATLIQNGSKLSGEWCLYGCVTISDGKVEGNKLSWMFDLQAHEVPVNAEYKDGAINGYWDAGFLYGSIELKRVAKKQ